MSEAKDFSNIKNANSGSVTISSEEKTTGIIAYITIIGLIIAYFQNQNLKSEYVNFHLRQMAGICIVALAGLIPFIGVLFSIAAIVLWIMGIIGAASGDKKLIPVLGEKFQEWFAGLGA